MTLILQGQGPQLAPTTGLSLRGALAHHALTGREEQILCTEGVSYALFISLLIL